MNEIKLKNIIGPTAHMRRTFSHILLVVQTNDNCIRTLGIVDRKDKILYPILKWSRTSSICQIWDSVFKLYCRNEYSNENIIIIQYRYI